MGREPVYGDTRRPMTELSPEVRRRRTFAIISHPDQSL
jgi:hypothetical protein